MLKSGDVDAVRQHCSWKTLQSEEQGVFSTWLKTVVNANPGCLDQLKQFNSDEERVLFCSSLEKVDSFVVQPIFKKKDANSAKLKREEGNSAFQKKWYKQAHMQYSLSAIKSPSHDDTLAYAIANRSACLYYLGQIKHCMADIHLAMACNYPSQLQYKLYERLAKCHILLKDKESAVKAAMAAKKVIIQHQDKLSKDKLDTAMKSVKSLIMQVTDPTQFKTDTIQVIDEPEVTLPKLSLKPSKKVNEFSSLLRVDYKPELGRHVKAEKTIRAGDTLAVEKPFASVVYYNKMGTNCDNCLKKLRNVVPCPDCAGVGYCSVACRDAACNQYHKYECHFQDLVQGLGSSALVRLALRIITSYPLDYFKKLRTQLVTEEGSSDFKNLYVALFNLVGLSHDRWIEDTFSRCMMAIALLKILKKAGYFGDPEPADSFTDDQIFIGSLLLHHLNVLQFNAHEVYEVIRGSEVKLKPYKNHVIGLAVYPRSSYFNHSCQPNTTRINIGNKLIIKSLVRIEKDEQVSDNYGQVFYFKNRDERQRELSARYWFHCQCPACVEDWPLLGKNEQPRWRTTEDHAKLDFYKSVYKCGVDFYDNGEKEEAIDNLKESINGLYEIVTPPLDCLTRAEDKLRSCYNLSGTVIMSDSFIRSNPDEKR